MDWQAAKHCGRGRPDIAIFLPSLNAGGTPKALADLAGGFDELGLCVDMVLCRAEGHYLTQLPDTVRVVDLRSSRVLRSLLPLMGYLREYRPRTMLSALTHANVIAVLAKLAVRSRTKLFVSERSHLSQTVRDTTSLRERLLPYLCPFLYNRTDGVICVSKGVADDLAERHNVDPGKLVTIPNGVEVHDLPSAGRAATADDIEEFRAGRPLAVSVGRLVPEKDHALLLSAVKLARESSDLCLAIIGDGPLTYELARTIDRLRLNDCVRLVGFDATPARWMTRCDVFVHSSRREGFPNALVEAMACGAPIVATDCPSGPREILEDGKWGRLVPVGDASALALAICATLKSKRKDASPRVSQFARETVLHSYLNCLGLSRESRATSGMQ